MLWKRGWRPVNLIDTNVILRYLLGEITDYPGIRELFERLKKDAELVECLIIVFFQVIFVMRSFYKIGREKIIAIVEKLLRRPGFYVRHKPIILLTLDIWRRCGRCASGCPCRIWRKSKDLQSRSWNRQDDSASDKAIEVVLTYSASLSLEISSQRQIVLRT